MKKSLAVVCLFVAHFASAGSAADSFVAASDRLCQKQKACVMQQTAGEQMEPQMRQMMEQMVDGMCASLRQGFVSAGEYNHPLHGAATACMDSLAQLSCSMLENGEVETPACQEYERQAAAYAR